MNDGVLNVNYMKNNVEIDDVITAVSMRRLRIAERNATHFGIKS